MCGKSFRDATYLSKIRNDTCVLTSSGLRMNSLMKVSHVPPVPHATCRCKHSNLSNGELFLLTHSFLNIKTTASYTFLRNEGNFVIQILVSQVYSCNQPILFFSKQSQRICFLLFISCTTLYLQTCAEKRGCFAKHQPCVAGRGWQQLGRNFLST